MTLKPLVITCVSESSLRLALQPSKESFCTVHFYIIGSCSWKDWLGSWSLGLQGPFSEFFSSKDGWQCIVAKVFLDQTMFSGLLNAAGA